MSDASVGVPVTPEDVGQKQVDCETLVRDGVTYYRQRINAHAHYKDCESGVYSPVLGAEGFPFSMDYLTAIGSGCVAGHTTFNSLGYNPDITTVREDICEWGGTYIPPPSGGIQMVVQSTSAADDGSPVGTGVWTVEINYLDDVGAEQTEIVTLNGITAVNTVATNIWRVNQFHTKTADITTTGTGEAAGNITLKNVAGTSTYAQITVGGNHSRHGFFTIPASMSGYITSATISVGGTTSGRFLKTTLRATCDHSSVLTPGIFQYKRTLLLMDAALPMPFTIPIKIPALCDIKISGVDENGSYVSSYIEGWLEPA